MNLYKNDLSYSEKDLEILLFLRDDEFPKYGINTISKLKLILNNQSVNN